MNAKTAQPTARTRRLLPATKDISSKNKTEGRFFHTAINKQPAFELGQIVATPALAVLKNAEQQHGASLQKHLILGGPAQRFSLVIFQGFADVQLGGFLGNQAVRCHAELESFRTPKLVEREGL